MKKRLTKKERYDEKIRKLEIERRFYNRNWEAMSFCNKKGLTIYPALQPNGKLVLFVQRKEKFKRLNDKYYNQEEDFMEYIAAIDEAYEKVYNKNK